MPLTDTHIRSLKPEATPRKYFDGDGLFLYVPPIGSMLWRMSCRFEGKLKLLSFREVPAASLMYARARHEEAKGLLTQGLPPWEDITVNDVKNVAVHDRFETSTSNSIRFNA